MYSRRFQQKNIKEKYKNNRKFQLYFLSLRLKINKTDSSKLMNFLS